jgi:hypothetical protein
MSDEHPAIVHFWDLRDEVERASQRFDELLAERDELKADQLIAAEMEIDIRRLEGLLAGVFTALHPPDAAGLGRTVEVTELPQLVADLRAERNGLKRALAASQRAVLFYASVIKSGEAWSPACEQALREVLDGAVDDEGPGP